MGIVLNQSLKNTIITYIGFGIGAIQFIYILFFLVQRFTLTNYVTSSKCNHALFFGMQIP
jgi:hypothetical protein